MSWLPGGLTPTGAPFARERGKPMWVRAERIASIATCRSPPVRFQNRRTSRGAGREFAIDLALDRARADGTPRDEAGVVLTERGIEKLRRDGHAEREEVSRRLRASRRPAWIWKLPSRRRSQTRAAKLFDYRPCDLDWILKPDSLRDVGGGPSCFSEDRAVSRLVRILSALGGGRPRAGRRCVRDGIAIARPLSSPRRQNGCRLPE